MNVLVVGTDFSARSELALRRATLLAQDAGYELLLVHVVPGRRSGSGSDRPDDASELLSQMQRRAVDVDGVQCRTDVRSGSVSEELIRAATEVEAGSILIGRHQRAVFRDWFTGSTAEKLIAQAATPLIVVNDAPDEPWRRCLLPVDFGPAARQAADAASRLPYLAKSHLVFAHIYDAEAREMMGRALMRGVERDDYLRKESEAAHAKLREFVDDLDRTNGRLVVRESGGSISRDLAGVCHDEEVDLIIVSSSNKGMVEHAILGSVTADILRHGATDVMVVPSAR